MRFGRRILGQLLCAAAAMSGLEVASAASASAEALTTVFRPLAQCRLLDTREQGRTKPTNGQVIEISVREACGVTTAATAVVVTMTVVDATGAGFLTAWPSDAPSMPLASTVNYAVGETRANGALLSVGRAGVLSVLVSQSAHLVVDVSGEFVPARVASAGRYVPLSPARALDTRLGDAPPLAAGSTVVVALPADVPTDATAVAVMLTVTNSPGAGYVTAYPAGTIKPSTSSLNTDAPGQTRTATQIVPVTEAGMAVFTNRGGHLIVDLVGYFTGSVAPPSSEGLFIPSTPTRVLDTRSAGRLFEGGVVRAAASDVTGGDARAAAVNVTVTESGPAGYVTVWAAQTAQPGTPAVSYDKRDDTVANLGIVSLSTTGINVGSTSGSHVVVDITGWFTGSPMDTTEAEPSNVAPVRVAPTGPIGCLQYVPVPSNDGVYQILVGSMQTVVHIFTAGPKGPIVVLGDSLTAGAASQTARALRAHGWGPICVDATVSRAIAVGSASTPDGVDSAQRIRMSDPVWNDPSIAWVVALGTNDVGLTGGSKTLSDMLVAAQRAAIGPNPISWMNVGTARPAYQWIEAVFNASIAASGVAVIDWRSESAAKHWTAGDQVHLTTEGYNARAELLAASVRSG